jgi:hypothetical protein
MFTVPEKNSILAKIKADLDGAFWRLFDGPVPASADDATTGSNHLIALISVNDDGTTGLTFATPSGGVMTKTVAEDWLGTIVANGTITFARLCLTGDAGTGAATTQKRIQATVGLAGSEINLVKVAVTTSDDPVDLNAYFIDVN